jgi:hypothetical protein
MTIKPGCCCSGSGAGAVDRFAPTILVGNTVEGDSAVAYSSGGFEYIPDIGDGAGIAAAIAALNAAGGDGRIYVRRGFYDLRLAGSPVAHFTLIRDQHIIGEGIGATVIMSRDTGAQTIFFCDGGGMSIQDMELVVPTPVGAVVGNIGVITLSDDNTNSSEILLRNLKIGLNADATTITTHCVRVENRNQTVIENCFAECGGARLGSAVADWLRFLGVAQVVGNEVVVRNCVANGFDAVVTLGLARNLVLDTVSSVDFKRRFLHMLAGDEQAHVTISNSDGTATDAAALGLSLHSHQDANIMATNVRLTGAAGATEPAVWIRSAALGGHAQIMGSTFVWSHVGGAVMEIGTALSASPCDRNTIIGNHFVNTDVTAGACSVQIMVATAVNNNVSLNSFEDAAGVGLIDGGTTTQAVGNV